MPKIMPIDINQLMESVMQQASDEIFQQAITLVEKNGVCFFRFTKEDGIVIIHPRFNSRLNGVIADA